eukprot:6969516-Pyramimonas_sp.AAC.1
MKRVTELREELENKDWSNEEAMLRQREEFETVKRTLQRQLQVNSLNPSHLAHAVSHAWLTDKQYDGIPSSPCSSTLDCISST